MEINSKELINTLTTQECVAVVEEMNRENHRVYASVSNLPESTDKDRTEEITKALEDLRRNLDSFEYIAQIRNDLTGLVVNKLRTGSYFEGYIAYRLAASNKQTS